MMLNPIPTLPLLLAGLVLLVEPSAIHADESTDGALQLLVTARSAEENCSAKVIRNGEVSSLDELMPATSFTYKDTTAHEDVEFHQVCEVRIPKNAFLETFGFCAVAGGSGCWMGLNEWGGRRVYLSTSGPSENEACMYVCTGPR